MKDTLYLKMNLSFFADKDGKTEEPTQHKKDEARKEGQLPKSQEVGTAFLFIAAFFSLKMFAPSIFRQMSEIFLYNFQLMAEIDDIFTTTFMSKHVADMFGKVLLATAPLFLVVMTVGVAASLIQTGWNVTTKPLMPKFSHLNPASGIKRLFSMQVIVNLVKAIAKFLIIGYAIYNMLQKEIESIPKLAYLSLIESVIYLGELAVNMGINVGILFLFIALADVFYTRFKHNESLKMTKQEVKDEHKQTEGDPQVKGRIRSRMMQISMRRMMQDVPQADVIITNPTHYAVAIKYDRTVSDAPRVVGKGADYLAKRIREKAKEHNVQIVENKHLARTLYATVEVGQEIPPELYQAVAEILAFVYKLKGLDKS